jgi:ankyrin repeat protein
MTGSDLSIENKEGKTAFSICFDHKNTELMKLLQENISFDKTPSVLFDLSRHILDINI